VLARELALHGAQLRASAGEVLTFEDAHDPVDRTGTLEDAWFNLSFGPLRDDQGDITGVAVSASEITRQHQAEAERNELLQRVKAAQATAEAERLKLYSDLMQAPISITRLDGPEHTITFANALSRSRLGAPDAVGRPLFEVRPEMRAQGFDTLLGGWPRLFQPMQHGAEFSEPSRRNVGLRLYIVKHIVDAHAGTIAVRSTDGEGTTFTLRLPRDPSQQLRQPVSAAGW
jgi:PAS domain-containing protein